MRLNETEIRLNETEWDWMRVNETEWDWMRVNETEWEWMRLNETEMGLKWDWNESEWDWMRLKWALVSHLFPSSSNHNTSLILFCTSPLVFHSSSLSPSPPDWLPFLLLMLPVSSLAHFLSVSDNFFKALLSDLENQKCSCWFSYKASNTYLHWSYVCLSTLFPRFCYQFHTR